MSESRRVHDDLVDALDRLRHAEHSAVTLFARVLNEQLFRDLGCATIEIYAARELGLAESKTRQFLRLARALDDLPAVRAALDDGRLTWTKARTISGVATARTQERWVDEAATATSRQLESKVRTVRARNRRERDRRRRHRGQAALVLDAAPAPEPVETPITVTVTMTPVQHARYEALMERLRKQGRREACADLVLDGMAALNDETGTREASATPCHIVGYRCDTCNTTTVGGRPVAPAVAEAMACDAIHMSPDPAVRNRATIPPSVRRAVLARDGHRCTTAGCCASRFLEVHHVTPRARGGTNDPDNLATLCGSCHRFAHEREPT